MPFGALTCLACCTGCISSFPICWECITVASYMTDLIQMLPYVVTIVVLIVVSLRKKKENQPPEHLGLSYFREER